MRLTLRDVRPESRVLTHVGHRATSPFPYERLVRAPTSSSFHRRRNGSGVFRLPQPKQGPQEARSQDNDTIPCCSLPSNAPAKLRRANAQRAGPTPPKPPTAACNRLLVLLCHKISSGPRRLSTPKARAGL